MAWTCLVTGLSAGALMGLVVGILLTLWIQRQSGILRAKPVQAKAKPQSKRKFSWQREGVKPNAKKTP